MAGIPKIVYVTDILRNPLATDFLYNLIYLNQTSTITLWNTLGADQTALFAMKSTNFLQTVFPVITPTSTGPTDVSITLKTFSVYTGLAAGWYGVRFSYTPGGSAASASFQSYPYACPYTSGVTDPRGAFDPCSSTMAPAGDPTNLHQVKVIRGHGCNPATQYFDT